MERRDLYQDDLTEERYPTPAERDDVARSQDLDPDVNDDDEDLNEDADTDDEEEDGD